MAIRSFRTAFPWGAPKATDRGAPIRDITELIKSIQEIKRVKYESKLYSDIIENIDKPRDKVDLQQKLTELEQIPAGERRAAIAEFLPSEAESRAVKRIGERFDAQPSRGIFSKIGRGARTLFDPTYEYRGPITELEKTILQEQEKEGIRTQKTQYDFLLDAIKEMEKKAKVAAKPPTARADSKTRFFRAIETGIWYDPQGKDIGKPVETQEELSKIARIERIDQDPEVRRAIETFKFEPGAAKKTRYRPFRILPGGEPFKKVTPVVPERRTYEREKIYKLGETINIRGKRYKVMSVSGRFSPSDPDLKEL